MTALRYVLGLGMKGKIALGMGCSRGTGFDTKKPYNSGKTSAVRDWASKAVPSILSALVSGTLFSLPQMLLSVFIYLPTESSEEPSLITGATCLMGYRFPCQVCSQVKL